ncbi:hypothetical protein BDV06DRAFT_139906 [Aspergillus oleicola]
MGWRNKGAIIATLGAGAEAIEIDIWPYQALKTSAGTWVGWALATNDCGGESQPPGADHVTGATSRLRSHSSVEEPHLDWPLPSLLYRLTAYCVRPVLFATCRYPGEPI